MTPDASRSALPPASAIDSNVTQASSRRRLWGWVVGLGVAGIGTGMVVMWLGSERSATLLHGLGAMSVVACALGLTCGLLAGFLAGLFGIGGSLVVVPGLYLLLPAFGVPASDLSHAAVATALAAMLPSALCGACTQYRRGGLELAWLARLAPGTCMGAAGGALVALQLHGPTLALMFVAQSLYYGWGLLQAPPTADSRRSRLAQRIAAMPMWSVAPLSGAFCACLGMGGGSLLVPYMTAHGVSLLRATANSQALNLCIAFGGAIGFGALAAGSVTAGATVCWPAALLVGAAATSAVPFGVAAASRMRPSAFRRALGIINLVAAAVLLLRTLQL